MLYHVTQSFIFHGIAIEVECTGETEAEARLCGEVIAMKLWELDLTEFPEV